MNREDEISRITDTDDIPNQPIADQSNRRQRREERQKQLDRACLKFWVSMFDHDLNAGDFESGIISGLAVLGLNTENGGWKAAMNYTYLLIPTRD